VNKLELAEKVAQATGLSKDQANNAVTALVNSMMAAVAKGETVRIPGFGTWTSRTRPKRKGINPQTKKVMQIPAKKVPAFKPGSVFRDVVANPSKASKLLSLPKPPAKQAAKKAAAKPAGKAAAKKTASSKPAAKKTAARKPAATGRTTARKTATGRATARKKK